MMEARRYLGCHSRL